MPPPFVRTDIRLADGRSLHYYDRSPGEDRSAPDRRPLEPFAARSEVRRDRLLDEPVFVAAHRQARTYLPPTDLCPLCPTRDPERPTEIPAADYEVVAFDNRFPSFADPGRCEVVCFTADHDGSFAGLSVDRVRLIVDAWADRTRELSTLPGVEQVFVFENRGEAIGVTLQHPHGQIYAYPFVTPRSRRMLDVAGAHRAGGGGDIVGDRLAIEREGPRVVVRGERWTAFVPEAARWPIELHVVPHRFVADLTELEDEERDELAAVLLDAFGRLDRFHGTPLPYMAGWYQAPVHGPRELVRLHLQVVSIQRAPDRLKYLAGSESLMGVFINDLVPEETARRLRDA